MDQRPAPVQQRWLPEAVKREQCARGSCSADAEGTAVNGNGSPGPTIDKMPRMTDDAWSGRVVGESDPQFVPAVREAASIAYSTAAGQPTHEVYVVLASELRQRGIYPDPEAVLEAAMLISRGKKPAVLRD